VLYSFEIACPALYALGLCPTVLACRVFDSVPSFLLSACRALIDYIRANSPAHLYASAMSPAAVEMVISALHIMTGADGSSRGLAKIAQVGRTGLWACIGHCVRVLARGQLGLHGTLLGLLVGS
jgi:hypothetical protein